MLGVVERGAGEPLGSRHPRRGQRPGRRSVEPHAKELRRSRPERIRVAYRPRVQRRVVELFDGDATPLPGKSRELRERAGPSCRRLRPPEDLGHRGGHATILPRCLEAAAAGGCVCGGADGLIRCARRYEVRLSAVALEFLDLGLGSEYLDYQSTWDLQRAIHAEVSACTRPDTVLLLEHSSVYTAGKRTEPQERPLDGTPVIDVDRGGKITWHGPGQLVGYPIVRLPESVLVVDYVRRLEEAMIAMFAEFGLSTGRIRGRSGVWLAGDAKRLERKIAAIGVRVAAGTTMHGFAINVDPDLRWFDRIIPCGLTDVGVTSVAAELGTHVTVSDVAQTLRPHLQRYLAFEPYLQSPDIGSAPDTTSDRLVVGAA